MPEAFATVRESARRVLGQRHFDVQIMGGAALHLGNIAEMKTGEGKTLVATLAGLPQRASRQGRPRRHRQRLPGASYHAEWMGRVYHFLGMTVGIILPGMSSADRREAYGCDITYATNNELGFDYLRDNMAGVGRAVRAARPQLRDRRRGRLDPHRRGPHPADHLRPHPGRGALVRRVRRRSPSGCARDDDYEVDEKKRTVSVLEGAIDKVEDHLGIENLYDSVNTPLISFLNNAIKAKELFRRDKEYVVMNGEVLIVDEHTGRMLEGRRYNEGLHQAIEAKENVRVREEYQTLATITLQNYFRLYDKLAGMTGTAMTEASEFDKIYGLGVVPIPTNQPVARVDQPDLVYRTEDAKFDAVVEDIAERHEAGPAGPGRHDQRGEVRAAGHGCWSSAASRTRCSTPSSTSARPRSSRWPGTRARSPWPPTWPVAAPTSCSAAASSSSPTSAARARARPQRDARGLRGRLARGARADEGAGRRRARRGGRGRRPDGARHRAARVAAHRQPAARPLRPPGRPGRVAVLPVARGRPDAAVQVRLGRLGAADAQGARRRADREQARHRGDRVGAGAGGVAELRVPQEHPQVRRRDEPAARGRLRRAAPGARGRGPARAGPADDRRDGRGLRHRCHRGLPGGVGPRRAVDRAEARCTRSRSRRADVRGRARRPRRRSTATCCVERLASRRRRRPTTRARTSSAAR